MRYLDRSRVIQLIATATATLIAFWIITKISENCKVAPDLSIYLKSTLVGTVSIILLILLNGIYHLGYENLPWLRAKTAPNYTGKFEGEWLQKRAHKKSSGKTEIRYTILRIEHVKAKPESYYLVRGIAYGTKIADFICAFEGKLDVFGAENLKFEVEVEYPRSGGNLIPTTNTITTIKFNDIDGGVFTSYKGSIYDSHRDGHRKVTASRIQKPYEGVELFNAVPDYDFNEAYKNAEDRCI